MTQDINSQVLRVRDGQLAMHGDHPRLRAQVGWFVGAEDDEDGAFANRSAIRNSTT